VNVDQANIPHIDIAIAGLEDEVRDLCSQIERSKRRIDAAQREIAQLRLRRALMPLAIDLIPELLAPNQYLSWPEQDFLERILIFGISDHYQEKRLRAICANHSHPLL
jgi:hypothetical protein